MNQRFNSILETLGSVAVLVGLVFVGLELRQNAESVRSQTRSQISIAYSELIESQREDEDVSL